MQASSVKCLDVEAKLAARVGSRLASLMHFNHSPCQLVRADQLGREILKLHEQTVPDLRCVGELSPCDGLDNTLWREFPELRHAGELSKELLSIQLAWGILVTLVGVLQKNNSLLTFKKYGTVVPF